MRIDTEGNTRVLLALQRALLINRAQFHFVIVLGRVFAQNFEMHLYVRSRARASE